MAAILLGERVPEDARVLVLGAGGGLELEALAECHSGWRFDGVDPAREMLNLAKTVLGPLALLWLRQRCRGGSSLRLQ